MAFPDTTLILSSEHRGWFAHWPLGWHPKVRRRPFNVEQREGSNLPGFLDWNPCRGGLITAGWLWKSWLSHIPVLTPPITEIEGHWITFGWGFPCLQGLYRGVKGVFTGQSWWKSHLSIWPALTHHGGIIEAHYNSLAKMDLCSPHLTFAGGAKDGTMVLSVTFCWSRAVTI